MECEHRTGMHAWIDIDYTEVVQHDQPNVMVPMGDHGAVDTHLWRRSQPMIRIAGDETVMIDDDCDCGRTYPRAHGIIGRLDDMLIIRGVNIYPSALEQAVRAPTASVVSLEFMFRRMAHLMKRELKLGWRQRRRASIKRTRKAKFDCCCRGEVRSYLGIRLPVDVVPPESFSKTAGKSRRIIDNR